METMQTHEDVSPPSPLTLGEMLYRAARQNPGKAAVLTQESALTYRELWEQAGALAAMLEDAGLERGDRIGCLLKKTPEAIVAFLGAALSRGVFFPVDPNLPWTKMQQVFNGTEAKFIIVDREYLDALHAATSFSPSRTIVIGTEKSGKYRLFRDIDRYRGNPKPDPSISAHDPVYLNFTSGTTGIPKGAVTTHANIWWNTRAAVRAFQLTAEDVHLIMFPTFVHPHEIFARSLFLSGTTVLLDTIQPKSIAETITRNGVSCFMAVASIYETLARLRDTSPYDFSSLRIPESGGMHVNSALVQLFHQKFGLPLYPVWGSTETTGIALYTPPHEPYRPGSMGRCCPGYEIVILNEHGDPVAPGEVGEMVVQGPGVCSRYENDSRETIRHLKDNRFLTGDLVYRDEEGYFYFQSRRTNLMKVGGLKVYPVEIEEVLRTHPDILDVAVVPVQEGLHGEVPKAVIVTKSGEDISKRDLRDFCEQKLHRYKFPRIIEFRETLPRTPGGKIAWKEL